MEVTKDTIIGDILDFDGETAKFFLEIGMHCLGCPASRGESIEMACAVHGTDAEACRKNQCLSENKITELSLCFSSEKRRGDLYMGEPCHEDIS